MRGSVSSAGAAGAVAGAQGGQRDAVFQGKCLRLAVQVLPGASGQFKRFG